MKFNQYGLLAPGDYPLTLWELRQSILVRGQRDPQLPWDSQWRLQLVSNLEICAKQLWAVGVEEIYIDGSFVTDKYRPNDIDGFFIAPDPREALDGTLAKRLNQLDPYQCWGWERRRFDVYGNLELEMWHRYRVELFPHCHGIYSGIENERGENMKFDEFFRLDRDFLIAKGIVKLVKG